VIDEKRSSAHSEKKETNISRRPFQTAKFLVGRTRGVASVIGVVAGLIGIYHGYNETLQGSVAPSGVFINAVGPPCQGNCFPAMTLVPNFLLAGILTIIVAILVIVWSTAFVQKKNGGIILILLSIILLLVGGGFLAPILGFAAGIVGTRIRRA
jgi:hypothetical protein